MYMDQIVIDGLLMSRPQNGHVALLTPCWTHWKGSTKKPYLKGTGERARERERERVLLDISQNNPHFHVAVYSLCQILNYVPGIWEHLQRQMHMKWVKRNITKNVPSYKANGVGGRDP